MTLDSPMGLRNFLRLEVRHHTFTKKNVEMSLFEKTHSLSQNKTAVAVVVASEDSQNLGTKYQFK